MIYLDNAATTFPKPNAVYEEMDRVNRTLAVNAGRGSYRAAHEALQIIEETKSLLKKLFNAEGCGEVVLTPSITHAFHQIVNGLTLNGDDTIYLSPYEHNAVARAIALLCNNANVRFEIIPTDKNGMIDLEETRFAFSCKKPGAVFCTGISNVTGYLLPFSTLFDLAKDCNNQCVTVLDAAQAAGLINIDFAKDNIDILAFAGHKTLQGPFGVAGFVLSNNCILREVFAGGTGSDSLNLKMPERAPEKYEASSQNVVAIAGLRAALKSLNITEHYKTIHDLTNYFIDKASTIPKVKLVGIINNDNIGIVSFVVDGFQSDDVGSILDEEFDIAVRTGYHCAPFVHDIIDDKSFSGTIRVGFGSFNTKEDIDELVKALETL